MLQRTAKSRQDVPPPVALEDDSPRQEDVIPCRHQFATEDVVHAPQQKTRQEHSDTLIRGRGVSAHAVSWAMRYS